MLTLKLGHKGAHSPTVLPGWEYFQCLGSKRLERPSIFPSFFCWFSLLFYYCFLFLSVLTCYPLPVSTNRNFTLTSSINIEPHGSPLPNRFWSPLGCSPIDARSFSAPDRSFLISFMFSSACTLCLVRPNWQSIPLCLVRSWNVWLVAMWTITWLSQNRRGGGGTETPESLSNWVSRLNHLQWQA